MAAAVKHGVPSQEHSATVTNYNQGRQALHIAQHRKCAFCERWTPLDGNALEHFRPKNGAIRGNGGVDEAHYGWLCWTWENHVFSCNTCNGQSRKGNQFPVSTPMPAPIVSAGMTSLPAAAFDWSQEGAMLVDPATENPLDHLDWRPSIGTRLMNRRLWQWEVYGLTARGKATIEILNLDQNVDTVTGHVRSNILSRVEVVERSIQSGDKAQAKHDWEFLLDQKVEDADAELRGPTFCALEYLLPTAIRQAQGLRTPVRP